MARLTRAESQAHTRQQLVATARRLFYDDGFHATSLEKVADAAGFTKGAVYSNFRNKDELCVVVLDEVRKERLTELMALLADADLDSRLERLQEWGQRVIGDPDWTSLELEFAVHARRDEVLRSDLSARLNAVLGALAAASESAAAADADARSPRELVTAYFALGVGLGVFRAIDPSIPVDGLIDVIRATTGQSSSNAGVED